MFVPVDRPLTSRHRLTCQRRIQAYARAWSLRNREGRQHRGPLTRAFLDVLQALLWGFHNSRTGICFPSYERIAEKAECARSTVAEALKVLEWAGVLTWQHRITRVSEHYTDLFGRTTWRWRVIRTSNAYAFRDPQEAEKAGIPSRSENRSGTPNQGIQDTSLAGNHSAAPVENAPQTPLERALASLSAAIAAKNGIEDAVG